MNYNNDISSGQSSSQLSEAEKSQYEADKIKLGKLLMLGSPGQTERHEILEVNIRINEYEYNNGISELYSYPVNIVLGTNCKCNAQCIFCTGPKSSPGTPEFSIELFKEYYEKKIGNALMAASDIHFCSYGEPLLMQDFMGFVDYLNKNYPYPSKAFTTNGIGLNPEIIDAFIAGRYVLHVSLHASRSDLHKQLTNTSTFDSIIKNLEYARRRREEMGSKMTILLVFVVTTLNVRDIPEFIKLAIKLGADIVKFDYMTIYTKEMIKYSCFFAKELTDEMFEAAKSIASGKIELLLPPLFNSGGETPSPVKLICRFPWNWAYMDTECFTYCCVASQTMGNLQNNKFEEIWNSEQYKNMRRSLVGSTYNKLCEDCMNAQPLNINDFSSHVTHSQGVYEKIMEEYKSMPASFTPVSSITR